MIRIIPEECPHIFGHGIAASYQSQFSIGKNSSEKTPELASIRVWHIVALKEVKIQVFCFKIFTSLRIEDGPAM